MFQEYFVLMLPTVYSQLVASKYFAHAYLIPSNFCFHNTYLKGACLYQKKTRKELI